MLQSDESGKWNSIWVDFFLLTLISSLFQKTTKRKKESVEEEGAEDTDGSPVKKRRAPKKKGTVLSVLSIDTFFLICSAANFWVLRALQEKDDLVDCVQFKNSTNKTRKKEKRTWIFEIFNDHFLLNYKFETKREGWKDSYIDIYLDI